MGDRANVVIVQRSGSQDAAPDGFIYLYTHWGGSEAPEALQTALAKRQRWDDAPYLTRIIFDTLSFGAHGQETGFGISTRLCDNEWPLLVVDPDNQQVWTATGADNWNIDPIAGKQHGWTFEEYATLDMSEDGWGALGHDE